MELDSSCSHCNIPYAQNFGDEDDPRGMNVLRCGHIFCLCCLQTHTCLHGRVACPTCKRQSGPECATPRVCFQMNTPYPRHNVSTRSPVRTPAPPIPPGPPTHEPQYEHTSPPHWEVPARSPVSVTSSSRSVYWNARHVPMRTLGRQHSLDYEHASANNDERVNRTYSYEGIFAPLGLPVIYTYPVHQPRDRVRPIAYRNASSPVAFYVHGQCPAPPNPHHYVAPTSTVTIINGPVQMFFVG
ncbi:hypothetical protein PENSPDRAFT_341250 [Peniophora sp. CONT]|nr:hypothetical protein PENSPDRAFT_341250 [Peniophora sp. CONT]